MIPRHLRTRVPRVLRPALADPHVLLALAVVVSVLLIETVGGWDVLAVVPILTTYVLVQTVLAIRLGRGRTSRSDTLRLLVAVGAVFLVSLSAGDVLDLPLTSLYIPVVAMAAAIGTAPTLVVGAAVAVAYGVPALSVAAVSADGAALLQRGVSLTAALVVLVVGTRRTIGSLEHAVRRARAAMASERRRGRQLGAVTAVGEVLAKRGAASDALEEVMDLLVDRYGYRHVSIYTLDDDADLLRLGAQRGYADPVHTFGPDTGVMWRVIRSGRPALVKDVHADPDYHAADPAVRSEVSVPLLREGVVAGVLNIESTEDMPLDESDLVTMVVVGDRIAAALELGRERQALRERAEVFARLATFGVRIGASLDPAKAHEAIVAAVAEALDTDIVTLVLRGERDEDRVVAIHGGDPAYVGVHIPPGEGMIGRAIASGATVTAKRIERAAFPSTMQQARVADTLTGVAIPFLVDGTLGGGLSLARADATRVYSRLEHEALELVAVQVALALQNVALHAQVADAAVRDPLTGLWNRRHLEASVGRMSAARDRQAPDDRRPMSAIMFDLDHFGAFNKRHGHAVGDEVLRAFGVVLARRLRSSDLVARYGGEEFVAILDGATLDEARRIADEVRVALEATIVMGADGGALRATVSAGCAAMRPDVISLETLLEVADVALQMAKRAGRNQVVAA